MLGFVAQNVLDGTMPQWHAADLDEVVATSLVLDVRSRAEHAGGHLDGALNVPHTELRERLDEVRAAAAGRPSPCTARAACGRTSPPVSCSPPGSTRATSPAAGSP